MEAFTTYFSSKKKLKQFLDDNKIIDTNSLMIQVFTPQADRQYIQELLNIVNELLPLAHLIGSTTDGQTNHGVLSKDKTVLSFTLFSHTKLTTYISNNFDDFYHAGENLALELIENNTKVILSFIAGIYNDDKKFLSGVKYIDEKVKVVAATAGVKTIFIKSLVFTKDYIYTNAVVGIALHSNKLHINTENNCFWQVVGHSLTITKAHSNRVYTINNRTAYDTFAHYLGEDIAKQLPAIGIEFPLVIKRNNINIIRAVLQKEDDGSLIFAGDFKEGDEVNFSYLANNSGIGSSKKNIKEKVIGAIFIPHHYSNNAKILDIPTNTASFLTYGKFSRVNKTLNQSTALLILSESDAIDVKPDDTNTVKALSHLINTTTRELQRATHKLEKHETTMKRVHLVTDPTLKNKIHTLRGSNVLLTEDNKTNQKILQGIFKNIEINLDIANNGQEAISAINSKDYELILMDVQMPIMGGLEASAYIRKTNKNIPIIALTANAKPEDIEETKLAGMNEHLNKPIDLEKLYATLLKYIHKKTDLKKKQTPQEEMEIPYFKYIDTDLGLKHLGGNKILYIRVLKDFVQRYKNINLEFLSHEEYDRVLHTLQGLSANIGATDLYNSTNKLHFHVHDTATAQFYKELHLVIAEIQTLIKPENNQEVLKKQNISQEKKEHLFKELKNALEEERPKVCEKLIQKLSQYYFSDEDEDLLTSIKVSVDEFEFDEALNIISKIY